MIKKELSTQWRMRRATEEEWHHAEIPGTVYTDLLRNGGMQDPFWKDNEDAMNMSADLRRRGNSFPAGKRFCGLRAWIHWLPYI